MKFSSHDDGKDMDIENLDAIIKRCEEAMGKKFKKPEAEGSPVEEAAESPEEEKSEHDDMDESDLNDLLDMYKKLKG